MRDEWKDPWADNIWSQVLNYQHVLTRMPIVVARCPGESDFSGEGCGVVLAQGVIPVRPVACTVLQVEVMTVFLRSRVLVKILLVGR